MRDHTDACAADKNFASKHPREKYILRSSFLFYEKFLIHKRFPATLGQILFSSAPACMPAAAAAARNAGEEAAASA